MIRVVLDENTLGFHSQCQNLYLATDRQQKVWIRYKNDRQGFVHKFTDNYKLCYLSGRYVK